MYPRLVYPISARLFARSDGQTDGQLTDFGMKKADVMTISNRMEDCITIERVKGHF